MKKTCSPRRGFTLIETIIYIGLFSVLLGTAFITAYHIIDGSRGLSARTVVQSEGNFVIRKINWALIGAETITIPSSSSTTNLRVTKYDGTKIEICLDGNKIKMHQGTFSSCDDANYIALTTDNVEVSHFEFELIPATGSGPKGIKSTIIITENKADFPFTITKYLRQ